MCRSKDILLKPNQICYGARKDFFQSNSEASKQKVCNTCFNVLYEPALNKATITKQQSTKKLLDVYS